MGPSNQVAEWLSSPAPVPITEVKDWVLRSGGADEIEPQLGNAFLLLRVPLIGGRIRTTQFRTVHEIAAKARAEPPLHEARVFFVRPTGRSTFPNFISVGRIINNDVVLDDGSVTKFHAYFRVEGGTLLLCDAGSSNGTFANGKKVPVKDKGSISPKNNMALRFGTVETTFLDAAGLTSLLVQI